MYDIQWLNQGRVLEITLSGILELDEMVEMNKDYYGCIREEGVAPVHVIVDAREVTNLKMKAKEINNFFDPSTHSLFGWTIIVTDNRFLKFMIAIFAKLTGSQFKTVADYDEAVSIIQKHVPELLSETI